MNNWKKIWEAKGNSFIEKEDVFEMFCELKKANGFDVQTDDNYYKNFWLQWHNTAEKVKSLSDGFKSVYEVGCGSGVNLYMFQQLYGILELGGMDYSNSLLNIAKSVLNKPSLICDEAINLNIMPKYDFVLADSVFQYFESSDYGMKVLEKMYQKAEKIIVITEIHDIEQRDLLLEHRRASVENYDELYKGLDKTFYSKNDFEEFAESHNCKIEIAKPQNDSYWNNEYVFDCYFIK